MLTVGELFAGIGGIGLGLERAGFKVLWASEIDPYATEIYKYNFPNVNLFKGDIRDFETEINSVDIVCGGFPCQPHSIAGKREGTKDSRWLWPEFLRIIGNVRPKYAIIENVPGLRTVNNGEAFKEVLEGLAKSGYDAEWQSIRASDVGALHKRERLWVVAYPCGRWRQDNQLQTGRKKSRGNSKKVSYPESNRMEGSGTTRLIFTQEAFKEALSRCNSTGTRAAYWETEPEVGRLVDGLPYKLAKLQLTALGNAVVPQNAELIGHLINIYEEQSANT